MLIRSVQEDDLVQLVELCREHAAFEQAVYRDNDQANRLHNAFFGNPPQLDCVVVEHEKKLVGYATYMVQYTTWDAAYYLNLDCLYLRPEVRQKGIGRAIIEHLRQVAIEKQCINVQWHTPEFNENAIGFYHHLGAASKAKKRFFLPVNP